MRGVVYPGHPDLTQVPRGSLDDDWLPVVGGQGLVVVTRDNRIRYRTAERRLWVQHQVRGFVLSGRKSQSTADSAAVLEASLVDPGGAGGPAPRGTLDVWGDGGKSS